MGNINVSPKFILAGEAVYTVSSGHEHLTFKVYKTEPNPNYPNPAWFAKVLAGPDNTSDYRYMGMVVVPKTPDGDPDIKPTSKSQFDTKSRAFKVAVWSLRVIWQVERGTYKLPPGYSIKHDGNCGRCGAKLTHPASLDTGLGPECAALAGVEWAEHKPAMGDILPGYKPDPNKRRLKGDGGPERRTGTRTAHTIDEHTSTRDFQLARNDLFGFLTKREQ